MTAPFQQQIAVVAGLRRAFEQFKHHAAFTRRVKPLIVAELPGYTVSVELLRDRQSMGERPALRASTGPRYHYRGSLTGFTSRKSSRENHLPLQNEKVPQ